MNGFVLLSSYPKAGNTWLRAVLDSLNRGGCAIDINANPSGIVAAADRDTFDRVMGVRSVALTPTEIAWQRPYLWRRVAAAGGEIPWIKIHDAYLAPWPGFEPPFPADIIAHVIYVVRDPRDVAVSFASHFNVTIDDALQWMGADDAWLDVPGNPPPRQLPQLISSWSRHAESWLKAPGLNLHAARYEDMQNDPIATFTRIAEFLAIPAAREVMERAIAASRFDILREQEEHNGFRERESTSDSFFRRGIAGGWRDVLTDRQAARLVADHRDMMIEFGYDV